MSRKDEIVQLDIDRCFPYIKMDNLSEREDYIDFVRSVAEFGVIMPIIVRKQGCRFEVIAGNWRYYAAKDVNLQTIPAIVKEMSDNEARIIATETNLQQSGFEHLKHSELAEMIYKYHNAIKAQGKRTDIINEVYVLLNNMNDVPTFRPLGEKFNSAIESGQKFKISSRTVSRYLRVYLLQDSLKVLLDTGCISMRSAVELSYLGEDIQDYIASKVTEDIIIRVEDISDLRGIQKFIKLSKEIVDKLLFKSNRKDIFDDKLAIGFSSMSKLFKKYSLCRYTKQEIEEILDTALYDYFHHNPITSWYTT